MRHGGRTIAVLGTPLDRAYPRENAELQDRIAREHLVVSQFPPGSPTRRWNFPFRNRLMALVSSFTVIVEAGDSSGALSQGWEALRLGRRLHLTRSVYDDAALRWPRDMERYGAQVLSDENLGDLLEEIQALQALKWDREAELAF
jgi:DNA processing protein